MERTLVKYGFGLAYVHGWLQGLRKSCHMMARMCMGRSPQPLCMDVPIATASGRMVVGLNENCFSFMNSGHEAEGTHVHRQVAC